jgi:phosphopantetheinyl transferase
MTAMTGSEDLANSIKLQLANPLGLAELEIEIRSDWSTKNKAHRLAIRKHLAERLQFHGAIFGDLHSVMNLQEVPIFNGHAFSISHCPDLGGLVLLPHSNLSLGLDIELASRVTMPVVEKVLPHANESRIRSQLKRTGGERLCALAWAAKESSIKCFGNAFQRHSLHYGNVSLIKLEEHDSDRVFSFQSQLDYNRVRGLAVQIQNWVFALATSAEKRSTNSHFET